MFVMEEEGMNILVSTLVRIIFCQS